MKPRLLIVSTLSILTMMLLMSCSNAVNDLSNSSPSSASESSSIMSSSPTPSISSSSSTSSKYDSYPEKSIFCKYYNLDKPDEYYELYRGEETGQIKCKIVTIYNDYTHEDIEEIYMINKNNFYYGSKLWYVDGYSLYCLSNVTSYSVSPSNIWTSTKPKPKPSTSTTTPTPSSSSSSESSSSSSVSEE